MTFVVGQTVVHPFHGPMRIAELTRRRIRSDEVPCYLMTNVEDSLQVIVPVASTETVGLRDVSSPERIAELISILSSPSHKGPTQWSQRMKYYESRMATGRLEDLCAVIRDVSRDGPKTPASAEGQLLRTARRRLAAEISLSLQLDEQGAHSVIDEALHEEAASMAANRR